MLVIFALLEMADKEAAWIEEIRRRHDPQADLVPAHVTLVFPCEVSDTTCVANHAAATASTVAAIDFRLVSAVVVRDSFAPRSQVFLVPDLGAEPITVLHDRLNDGPLSPFLRSDIPYAPHVTVAATDLQSDADAVAQSLGSIDMRGRLEAITLANLVDGRLSDLRSWRLGAPVR